jgi:hypothetical protein
LGGERRTSRIYGESFPKFKTSKPQGGEVMDETEMLKEIFAGLCKSAVNIFHSEKEVMPFIFIFPREGEIVPVIPIKGDKEAASHLVQDTCRKVGAFAAAIVSEAWAVNLEKEGMWDGTPPSKRLDRVEILQVSIYSKSINRMKTWKIVRDGNTRSLEDYWREDSPDRVESRFFGNYFRVEG